MRTRDFVGRLAVAAVALGVPAAGLLQAAPVAASGSKPAPAAAKSCSPQGGQSESELNGGTSLVAGPTPGTETMVLNYTDEWPMDASDVRMSVNGQTWQNFEDGSVAGQPGDSKPAKPNPANHGDYAVDPSDSTHWTRTLPPVPGLPVSTLSAQGSWTWGHAQDLNYNGVKNNPAQVRYTFPIPSGANVTIAVYLTDGDHCGDYLSMSVTFANIKAPVFKLNKTVSPTGTVRVGTRLNYTVTVTNTGQVSGSPGVLDDNLSGLRSQVVAGPSVSGGSLSTVKAGQEWHWTVPTLAPGASATLTMSIVPLSTGTEVNSAAVSGYTPISVRTPVVSSSSGVNNANVLGDVPVPTTGANNVLDALHLTLPMVGCVLIIMSLTERQRRRKKDRSAPR